MKIINVNSSELISLVELNKVRFYLGSFEDNKLIQEYFNYGSEFDLSKFKNSSKKYDLNLVLNTAGVPYVTQQSLVEFNMLIHSRYSGRVISFNESRVLKLNSSGELELNDSIAQFVPIALIRTGSNSSLKMFIPGLRKLLNSLNELVNVCVVLIEFYKDGDLVLSLINNTLDEWNNKLAEIGTAGLSLSDSYKTSNIYYKKSINEAEFDRCVTICDADINAESINSEYLPHLNKNNQHASQMIYVPSDIISGNILNNIVTNSIFNINKINFNSGLIIDENLNIIYCGAITGGD